MSSYTIVIEQGKRNYSAFSPDVPGCIATGGTIDEALSTMRDALHEHLAALVADGEPLPEPRAVEEHFAEDPDLRELTIAHIPVAQVAPLALA
ncbi:MAG: type II toxin-antitoxin system HicB family antitoxin [Opitutaceae bacterium]|jgi:predicted RNase H-like HicB family nuclease|nr:type II toxin-antitoxin system HicB family antitoxin [Opitutaceae bacterium]